MFGTQLEMLARDALANDGKPREGVSEDQAAYQEHLRQSFAPELMAFANTMEQTQDPVTREFFSRVAADALAHMMAQIVYEADERVMQRLIEQGETVVASAQAQALKEHGYRLS